ncbi:MULTISPECIES: NAD(P)/FAD-dependent oxidoreductase [Exiguobacterium]|uniref:NAD(P)/FAD-dependent oxidoreductase n=1 Tax=Exiguobacterium TaxID=33986 RepID=UPI001BE7FA05|nr:MULTISPECIES: NAD(P)/FAD-dependent oxidoreductase [Exiguobacterium]MCT4776849.1 NAD(P)/FAD-dependent oxidoreductase [Exiguobacterium aquaticum]MCT4788216.1 NAD(P)/FAD-dependent oxidoreductase [Exiguobacterium mexicanum]
MNHYDCIVIGGGPAGLAATLTLGRARRNVAVFDNGTNRNRVTHASHGFLTRDGIKPHEFKAIGFRELQAYPSVSIFNNTIKEIKKDSETGLYVVYTDERQYQTENILLATGVQEKFSLPQIRDYYGKSLFSCPYCDGWELRDLPLAVIAENEAHAHHLAKLVFNWSKNLIVFTNGVEVSADIESDLMRNNIGIYTARIKHLHGNDGMLERIELETGEYITRKGGFVVPTFYRPNRFSEQLLCKTDEHHVIITDGVGRTSEKGIYTAGETEKLNPSSLLIAAAEGNRVATTINLDLTLDRF